MKNSKSNWLKQSRKNCASWRDTRPALSIKKYIFREKVMFQKIKPRCPEENFHSFFCRKISKFHLVLELERKNIELQPQIFGSFVKTAVYVTKLILQIWFRFLHFQQKRLLYSMQTNFPGLSELQSTCPGKKNILVKKQKETFQLLRFLGLSLDEFQSVRRNLMKGCQNCILSFRRTYFGRTKFWKIDYKKLRYHKLWSTNFQAF